MHYFVNYFLSFFCAHFCNEIERCQLWKSLKYFSILGPIKSHNRFEYVQWKSAWFCFIWLFEFTSVIKLRNFNFENHWNTLIFFDKKYMTSDLNKSHGKMSDSVLFPLFGFDLVIKLRNFDFESHWSTLIVFDIKSIWRQIWICLMEKCLILFHFHLLSSL